MNCVKLICVVLFSLFATLAIGQDFRGGLKGGFNLSQIDGDKLGGYNKGGLIFGGFINRELNPRLQWQMEMIYIAKGSKRGINPDKGQFEFRRIAINYVEVPILLQFRVEKMQTNFEMGLSFSTMIRSMQEDQFGETDLIGDLKRFEFGYLLGFNYQFGNQLSGNARFAYSLTSIGVDNKVLYTIWNRHGGAYHNVLEFTLNYYLQGEGK